jgi:hypothetical protein
MQGELDSMNKVLGTLSANSDPHQLALALRAALPTARNDERSALQKMSNKALRDSVVTFANQLRAMTARNNQQDEEISNQWQTESISITRANAQTGQPQTDEQKHALDQAWQRLIQGEEASSNQYQLEYKTNFAADAVSYRDELIRRLGPQGPPDIGPPHIPLSLSGWITPMSVDATALYLETLAKKLPNQQR